MVSHELRTPLTAILGFSEILTSDTRLAPDQQECIADIHRAGTHLLNIITNVKKTVSDINVRVSARRAYDLSDDADKSHPLHMLCVCAILLAAGSDEV